MTTPIPASAFEGFKPGRLWSLWEMVNFSFWRAHHVLRELSVTVQVAHHNMRAATVVRDFNFVQQYGAVDFDEIKRDVLQSCAQHAERCKELFGHLKCSHIDAAIRSLDYLAKHQNAEWSEINTRTRALRDSVTTELKGYLFYQYPKVKGEKLLNWKEEWKLSLASFPDIAMDAFSATDCYALAHNTASVFHSMRVAEYGLRALAKERGLQLAKNKPVEWGTWQEIIKALDEESAAIGRTWTAGRGKDAALEFYSGSRADLNGFKDEYRNQCMHLRARYDELQALRALTNVHAFMQRLACKMDHAHKRINWGEP